jgi:hypothetical protein
MEEAKTKSKRRWVFRLAGVGVLALVLALAARTSPGTSKNSVVVNGSPAAGSAATTSCASEDASEQAAQIAARNAAHQEDVQEGSGGSRAEDLAEHDAYVKAHLADSAEDEGEATGYGACTDSTPDIALPAP